MIITAMLIIGLGSRVAKATISMFTPSTCYTAAATTTLSYMTAGAATSTVSCLVGPDGANSARLNIEVNASSTATNYAFNIEESMDGIDYFPTTLPQSASTTAPFALTARNSYSIVFASSTLGGVGVGTGSLGVNGSNNRNHYSVDIPVSMRYVRVYASLPVGSAQGAVWMQILPRQSVN